jgi:hypothetical protein
MPDSSRALKLLIRFAPTYRSEAHFCTLVNIKTKTKNRMHLSHALAVTKLHNSKLVK